MKKFKKLNRKGFTLIELLAVIVILAVVMGVAATSVLSSMNNSRKSSLQNSAISAADAFRIKYTEYSMNSSDGKLFGYSGTTLDSLLSGNAQSLGSSTATSFTAKQLNLTHVNYDLSTSYVYFDKATSSFTVCLTANKTGSYYVAAAASSSKVTAANSPVKKDLASGTMWACSDNTNSWT